MVGHLMGICPEVGLKPVLKSSSKQLKSIIYLYNYSKLIKGASVDETRVDPISQ